jgi:hypothetical protein
MQSLRRQVIVLRRKVRCRDEFTHGDRLFFIQLYRRFPSIVNAITSIRPETLVRWHRTGFRLSVLKTLSVLSNGRIAYRLSDGRIAVVRSQAVAVSLQVGRPA